MRKVFSFVIVLSVLFWSTLSFAGEVTLAWDANDPTPDGYLLFERIGEGSQYNYTSPVLISDITNDSGQIPPNMTQITVKDLGRRGEILTYYFVLRAYVGTDQSGDSNEVYQTFDYRIPSVPIELAVEYQKDTNSVHASWKQNDSTMVDNWKIFYSETSGENYQVLDTIQNTGQTGDITTTKSLSVPSGTIKTFYFVVVAFRKDSNIFSANSAEVSVVIDKRVPTPPTLRIVNINIPVTE